MSKTAQPTPEQQKYQQKVLSKMPRSNVLVQCLYAFLVGGLICCLGQVISDLGRMWFTFSDSQLSAFTAICLVFLGALFTGIGVYDKLGKFAGAGSVVPITGFANSVVAPSLEYKREGYIMGVGAKMFSIAGPVLVYGITASVAVGIIHWLIYGTVL